VVVSFIGFVAPQKGVYLFSWTVSGYPSNVIVTELVVEQNTISSAGEQNGEGYPSGSMTALCKMENNHCFKNQNGVHIKSKVFTSYHSIEHCITIFCL
jgi:hypothetical protein